MKTCPDCRATLSDHHHLCEYCGYQFEKKEFNLTQKQNNIEVDNEFIVSFAKEWGIGKNNYSHLMQDEGDLIKIVGAAGLSEFTAYAFKLDQKNKEFLLTKQYKSSIGNIIFFNEMGIEREFFFIDWNCMEIELDIESESGKEIEILKKIFDSDNLSLEDKIKIQLNRQVSNYEKYNYVMVVDEFRSGEKFEEIFRIKKPSVYSNFSNIIELDGVEHFFYDFNTDQWQVKDVDYSFYKISDTIEYIGEEAEFIEHLKIVEGE